jgi:hypothetical protein
MHWYWLVDLQQVPTGLLVEPLDVFDGLFRPVVVGLGFVGGPFGLPPSIVGYTTSFLILVETSNFFSTYHTKSEC